MVPAYPVREYDLVVATRIRLYKTVAVAAKSHSATSETILALHLGKSLIVSR